MGNEQYRKRKLRVLLKSRARDIVENELGMPWNGKPGVIQLYAAYWNFYGKDYETVELFLRRSMVSKFLRRNTEDKRMTFSKEELLK